MADRRSDSTPMELKSFGGFEIKDAAAGEVQAIVATLGVVDKDGDVLLPGCFPAVSSVKMSGYAHDVVRGGALPTGKGVITVEGDKAIYRGRFFMSSERAREHFAIVRELGEDGEWSFGFPRTAKTAPMTDEWRARGARRLIAQLQPIEVSPVFIGAGQGTGTMWTKSATSAPPLEELNAAADRMFKRRVVR